MGGLCTFPGHVAGRRVLIKPRPRAWSPSNRVGCRERGAHRLPAAACVTLQRSHYQGLVHREHRAKDGATVGLDHLLGMSCEQSQLAGGYGNDRDW